MRSPGINGGELRGHLEKWPFKTECVCVCMCMCIQYRKLSDGLFLECCNTVAKEYPSIKFDSMIIDNTCMQAGFSCDTFSVEHLQLFSVMVWLRLSGMGYVLT